MHQLKMYFIPFLKYLFQLFLLPQMSSWIILQCLLRCVICFLIARVYANLEDMISNQDSSFRLHYLINSRCLGFLNNNLLQLLHNKVCYLCSASPAPIESSKNETAMIFLWHHSDVFFILVKSRPVNTQSA